MGALLKNGFSDIRYCYHSNIIYQMYMKYCSVCIYMYMVNDQYKVYKPKCILICANLYNGGMYTYVPQFFFLLSVHGSLKKKKIFN